MSASINLVMSLSPRYSETFISNKIRGLKSDGFRVLLFLGAGESDGAENVYAGLPIVKERALGAAVISIYALSVLFLSRFRRVVRYFVSDKKHGRTLVESIRGLVVNYHLLRHGEEGWLHFSFATLAIDRESVAEAIGAKMSLSLRGYDVSLHPLKNPGCFGRVFATVEKVHTISDDLLAEARRLGLSSTVSVQKIVPAIDTEFFSPPSKGLSGDSAVRFLTVGRLHWKKGLEETLMALRELSTLEPEIHWTYHVVGDGELLERVAYAASDLDLLDRVELKGRLLPEQVRNEYAAADIYIQYSIQEGYCNAVLEARSMGVPCVVSDAEGLPENVGNDRFGKVVPKCRPDLLAKALIEMIKLPAEALEQLSVHSRSNVIELNGLERQREMFRQFFAT